MNRQHILACIGTAAIVSTPVLAQTPIRINQLQRPNSLVISGRVVSVVGNNFTVNDGTGQVIVDAGPRWWQAVNLAPGEQVTVTGELGRSGEFDAFSIRRANGALIEIRSPDGGPPPWAGGPNRGRQQRQPGR
jgi:RNase P/RNase MRP subunit p29